MIRLTARTTLAAFVMLIAFAAGVFSARHDLLPARLLVQARHLLPADRLPIGAARDFNDVPDTGTEVPCPTDALVIVTAGQSNAANTLSDPVDADPSRTAYMFHSGRCYLLADPILGATGRYGSLWTAVGHRLAESSGRSVVILGGAAGGSSFADWLDERTGLLYRLAGRIREARVAGLEPTLILWQHGETDAARQVGRDVFAAEIERLIGAIYAKSGLGVSTRLILFRSSACSERRGPMRYNSELIAAQILVAGRNPRAVAGPDTDQLGTRYRYDGCHFNARGRDAVVALTLAALAPLLGKAPDG